MTIIHPLAPGVTPEQAATERLALGLPAERPAGSPPEREAFTPLPRPEPTVAHGAWGPEGYCHRDPDPDSPTYGKLLAPPALHAPQGWRSNGAVGGQADPGWPLRDYMQDQERGDDGWSGDVRAAAMVPAPYCPSRRGDSWEAVRPLVLRDRVTLGAGDGLDPVSRWTMPTAAPGVVGWYNRPALREDGTPDPDAPPVRVYGMDPGTRPADPGAYGAGRWVRPMGRTVGWEWEPAAVTVDAFPLPVDGARGPVPGESEGGRGGKVRPAPTPPVIGARSPGVSRSGPVSWSAPGLWVLTPGERPRCIDPTAPGVTRGTVTAGTARGWRKAGRVPRRGGDTPIGAAALAAALERHPDRAGAILAVPVPERSTDAAENRRRGSAYRQAIRRAAGIA